MVVEVDRFTDSAVYSPVVVDCDFELGERNNAVQQLELEFGNSSTANMILINDSDETNLNGHSQESNDVNKNCTTSN